MIKDNQKLLNRIHVLIDAVVTAISYLMAWYLKFATGFAETDPNVGVLDMYTYFRALYILVPLYLVLYYFFIYTLQSVQRGVNTSFLQL